MHRWEDSLNRHSSIVTRHSKRLVAAVALAFSGGIAASSCCREYVFAGIAAANFLLITASFLAFRRNRLMPCLATGLAALATSGLLMGLSARDRFSASDLRHHMVRQSLRLDEPVSSEGCVVKDSEMRGEESVTTVELAAFRQHDRWVRCKGKAIVRFPHADPDNPLGPGLKLMRGDRIRAWATWSIPRNFENPGSADSAGMLARRGIFLIGKVKSLRLLEAIPGGCADPWTRAANIATAHVQKSLEPLRANKKEQPAAILASLIIGEYSRLDNSTREAFQNSGTFHVLVISGLHVAWIAGLFLQFLKAMRLPERTRYFAAFALILFYTCMVGFQASITRCLWMFLLYLVGRILFRQADAVNLLLGSALILLVARPHWLYEAGFQLSFISVLALALTAAPTMNAFLKPLFQPLLSAGKPDRFFLQPGRYHRWGRALRFQSEIFIEGMADSLAIRMERFLYWLCRGFARIVLAIGTLIVTSLSVQIWLQPLLACYFNRISWISPFANLAMVPLSSLVLGVGIAGTLSFDWPCLGPAMMRMAGRLAAMLLSCAHGITAIPGGWQRCATPSVAWVWAGILLLLLWSLFEWRRFWIPCIGIVALLACLSRSSVPGIGVLIEKSRHAIQTRNAAPWEKDALVLSLTFLDVGEGDSIAICFPDKRYWILDAGGLRQAPSNEDSPYGFDLGEAVVSRYLWQLWVNKIERLMISHPDLDHAGGIAAVMNNFRVAHFDYPQTGPDKILTRLLNAAQEKRIPTQTLYSGLEESVGPVTTRVLHPRRETLFHSTNENSLVLELSYGSFSALLTGDLEKSGETAVLSHPGVGRKLLLKVAHHGSRSGTSDALLTHVQPRWAVISVGRNNPFGHPSKETLARILRHGAKPLSTMSEGAITFETDGLGYVLRSHRSGILERGKL